MVSNVLRDAWIAKMGASMCLAHPSVDPSDIHKIVTKTFDDNYKDTDSIIYNSYENTVAKTSLGEVVDWINTSKPLIAESGVFFYPKHKYRNLNIEIIKQDMLDKRNEHKALMFKYIKEGDHFKATIENLNQSNKKKAANSGYGAEGQSSSFLYNLNSASSVTAAARGQTATACQCFDNLFGDYVKFFTMDEFFNWVVNITTDSYSLDYARIVNIIPNKAKFVKRFVNKFLHPSLCDSTLIGNVYDGLDDEMRIRVYYKANLAEFLMNTHVADAYCDIALGKEDFIDPNEVPDVYKDSVEYISELVMEFVHYKYNINQYEDRTKYQKRCCVIVLDTDSTFIAYGNILKHVMENVLPYKLHKDAEAADNYKIKILNVLSVFSSKAIYSTLWDYLGRANVDESDRKHVKMKNEFYYKRVIVTHAKKSYIGLMSRQEDVVYDTPKLDVKGVNFFKSTASEKTSKFIYSDILMDQLFTPKDGKISLQRTYKAISEFQNRIADEIRAGDMGFLKRSVKVKSPDAYSNPMGIGQSKAVYIWNYIMPETEAIALPATVTLVKVRLPDRKSVAALGQWPEIYNKVLELFDTCEDIGDYIKDGVKHKAKGIKSIALPLDYEVIPDWVLAIIDVDTLVADNMKLFTQLYKPLGMASGTTTTSGASSVYYTNIVRI